MKGEHVFTPMCVTVPQELVVHHMKFENGNAVVFSKGELLQ